MKEEDQLRVDAKLDELNKRRSGKAKHIQITISNDATLNFQHGLTEIRKLVEAHNFLPDEVFAIGSQMQWIALQVKTAQRFNEFQRDLTNQLNDMFSPKAKTTEDKEEEKLKKEKEQGITRVGPGDEK